MTVIEYHRPKTLQEALELLRRKEPYTLPLAGGSALNAPSDQPVAVVDLQELGLDNVETRGTTLVLGATLTLQMLLEISDLPAALRKAVELETTYNLRQVGTVAGTLVAAGGWSPFTTVLLALDAALYSLDPDAADAAAPLQPVALGEFLPLRSVRLPGNLITQVTLPLNPRLAYQSVARTPADKPIVGVAIAAWPSGRTRVALCGYGDQPLLAMDGPEGEGLEAAVRNAFEQAEDEWASAAYRQAAAVTLAQRCLVELK